MEVASTLSGACHWNGVRREVIHFAYGLTSLPEMSDARTRLYGS
jgi:hypothetical protein